MTSRLGPKATAQRDARRTHERRQRRQHKDPAFAPLTTYELWYQLEERSIRLKELGKRAARVLSAVLRLGVRDTLSYVTKVLAFQVTRTFLGMPLTFRLPLLRSHPATYGLCSILAISVVHAAVPVKTDGAATKIIRHLSSAHVAHQIDRRLACAELLEIVNTTDSRWPDQLLGYIRHPDQGVDCQGNTPAFRTSLVDTYTADSLTTVLAVLEGEIAIGKRTLLGFDLSGFVRVPYYALLGERVGGSNPIQTGVKVVYDQPGRLGWTDKAAAIGRTAAYAAYRLPTNKARAEFVARTSLCARGQPYGLSYFGAPIAGALCSRVLFEKAPQELNLAELILWAAAARDQFRVLGQGASSRVVAKARDANAIVVQRARYLVARLVEAGHIMPDAHAELSDTLEHTAWKLTDRLENGLLTNPETWIDNSAPGIELMLVDELKLRSGHMVSASRHKLALDLPLQHTIARLTDKLTIMARRAGRQTPDLAVAVTETINGEERLRGVLQTKHGLWHGPISAPASVGPRRRRERPVRSMGSIGKALLAPSLEAIGISASCRAEHGISDHDKFRGGMCPDETSPNWVSMRTTLSHSWNTSFVDALLMDRSMRWLDGAERFGFAFDQAASHTELAIGATLGTSVVISPELAVTGLHFLSRVARTEIEKAVSEPVLISRTALEKPAISHSPISTVDLIALDHTSKRLEGPIRDEGGTMAAIEVLVPELEECDVLGKSGTTEIKGGGPARDRYAMLSATCDERTVTVFVMIGSPSIDERLGAGSEIHLRLVADVLRQTFQWEKKK